MKKGVATEREIRIALSARVIAVTGDAMHQARVGGLQRTCQFPRPLFLYAVRIRPAVSAKIYPNVRVLSLR